MVNILNQLQGGLLNLGTGGQYARDMMAQEEAERIRQEQMQQAQMQAQGLANLYGIDNANGAFNNPQQVQQFMQMQQNRKQFDRDMALRNRQQNLRENQFAYKQGIDMQSPKGIAGKQMEKKLDFINNFDNTRIAYKAALDSLDNQANKIESLENRANASTVGLIGDSLKGIAGTPSANFYADLLSVEADEAFSALQRMRDASPTGGALGSISERELDLLKSARVNLSQNQSPTQFRKNAELLRKQIEKSKKILQQTYQADLKKFNLSESKIDAYMNQMQQGQGGGGQDATQNLQNAGQGGGAVPMKTWNEDTQSFN